LGKCKGGNLAANRLNLKHRTSIDELKLENWQRCEAVEN